MTAFNHPHSRVVRMPQESGLDLQAAEANLANDLAERLLDEYGARLGRGEVLLDRTLTTPVLSAAISIFLARTRNHRDRIMPVLDVNEDPVFPAKFRFVCVRH